MADWGVTDNGFKRLRRPEIERSIIDAVNQGLIERGITEQITGDVNSVSGIIVQVVADKIAEMQEVLQGIYFSMYPDTATGLALDFATAYTGVRRRTVVPSTAMVTFYGADGTVIPRNSEISNQRTGAIWRTTESKTLSENTATEADFKLKEVNGNTTYSLELDGKTYTYTSPPSAVSSEIVNALLKQLNAIEYSFTPIADGFTITRIDKKALKIDSYSESLEISRLGIDVPSVAYSNQLDDAQTGELNALGSNISGIDNVANKGVTKQGTPPETDAELRERYKIGVFRTGAGTLPSLAPNMLSVDNVLDARVFENDTDETDSAGRPPHSVHYVILGGASEDVAEEIHTRKGAGIDTHGQQTVTLQKPYGSFTVHFDRPTPKYIWLRLQISLRDKNIPISQQDIKNNVAEQGSGYKIGDSVPTEALLCRLYTDENIRYISAQYAVTDSANDTPEIGAYQTGEITIDDVEIALFAPSRIRIELV